jgi:hypothetical protein
MKYFKILYHSTQRLSCAALVGFCFWSFISIGLLPVAFVMLILEPSIRIGAFFLLVPLVAPFAIGMFTDITFWRDNYDKIFTT